MIMTLSCVCTLTYFTYTYSQCGAKFRNKYICSVFLKPKYVHNMSVCKRKYRVIYLWICHRSMNYRTKLQGCVPHCRNSKICFRSGRRDLYHCFSYYIKLFSPKVQPQIKIKEFSHLGPLHKGISIFYLHFFIFYFATSISVSITNLGLIISDSKQIIFRALMTYLIFHQQ
jgi:hypothetical protein